jgi:hypothetical protein
VRVQPVSAIAALFPYAGDWSGESRLVLHRPVEATYLSVMRAKIESSMREQALLMRYAWQVEEEPQDGLLVLNQLAEVVAGYWFDSWHLADTSMALRGGVDAGAVSVSGRYPASHGPDWGWRIVLEPAADARLRFRMFNIPPDGDEELAVDTDLARA